MQARIRKYLEARQANVLPEYGPGLYGNVAGRPPRKPGRKPTGKRRAVLRKVSWWDRPHVCGGEYLPPLDWHERQWLKMVDLARTHGGPKPVASWLGIVIEKFGERQTNASSPA